MCAYKCVSMYVLDDKLFERGKKKERACRLEDAVRFANSVSSSLVSSLAQIVFVSITPFTAVEVVRARNFLRSCQTFNVYQQYVRDSDLFERHYQDSYPPGTQHAVECRIGNTECMSIIVCMSKYALREVREYAYYSPYLYDVDMLKRCVDAPSRIFWLQSAIQSTTVKTEGRDSSTDP